MQQNVCFSGSGASSHVYVPLLPLRCGVPEPSSVFYDDGSKLIIFTSSNQVYSWKTAPFSPHAAPSVDAISEGQILCIRFSLDQKLIAIQRSDKEIQLWKRDTGECFSHKYNDESENILGFFWTDSSLCDLVVIKTIGVDLLACGTQSKLLSLVERKKVNANWYKYTHETRLLLLASGSQSKSFSGFQISSAGIVRLPKFNMAMAKSELISKPILPAEDVYIVTLYGRIYCLQHDRVAMLLHTYRFYRDAVIQQGSIPIYSNKIAISVVDNVLLVHQIDAKVVILYDLYGDSRAPISAPLPLLFRGFARSNSSSSRSIASDDDLSPPSSALYSHSWQFLVPDLICDDDSHLIWKIHLDLEAISSSTSDVPFVLEFLQRRKSDAFKAKEICIALIRTIILERRPSPFVSKAIQVLISSCASQKAPTTEPTQRHVDGSALSTDSEDESHFGSLRKDAFSQSKHKIPLISNNSPAISLEELYSHVFAHVEEELSSDAPYLITLIIEILRCGNELKLKVPITLYVLATQLLARNARFLELSMFITSKIIEPSKEVAMQLMESGREDNRLRKLGLDMLRQLAFHNEYVVLLVQDGRLFQALLYCKAHLVYGVRPSLFLEAATSAGNCEVISSVLRFLCDYFPGFKESDDFRTFYGVLSDLSSAAS